MKDPVRGTARVVAASELDRGTIGSTDCSMHLIVQAEGLPATAVEHTDWTTPTEKWPCAGMTLPVTVDRADPDEIRIEWDEVSRTQDVLRAETETLAASVRTGAGPALPEAPEAAGVVSPLPRPSPGATVTVGDAAVVDWDGGIPGPPPPEDRLARLERLARLHEQGALSDAEFAAEKRRVLEHP
jgi:hypothetical protein